MVRILSQRIRMSSTFRFEPGSTRLDGQSRSNVMQLAQAIRDGRFGGRDLMFVGFSDGRGPATANRDLSAARAESVLRDVERALGGSIPSNVRIDTEAFGEALPMACDDTVWGQQTNRRVELWVRDTR
jgi:phosphate transport system substrate-binding protein